MGMVRALRQLGHTVEVSSPPGCDPERDRADAWAAAPAPVEGPVRSRLKRFARNAPPVLFELAELCYNFYSAFDMLRRGRRRRPDIIYERTTSNSIAPTLLARWWNVPIVQEVNVTAHVGRLRPLVLRRLTQSIERWAIRRATLIVSVSFAFRRLLVEDGFPPEKIIVCQNALDPERFDPAVTKPADRPADVLDGGVVVGYVGTFLPWHRADMLVEAARELAPTCPQARWLLVGDGVERPRVEALLAEYGLADRFWMPGAVAHRLVPSYVMAMDAAVVPHSNPHGSPMKLFEYMAMGKAVVAPRVPPIEEVVRDGETGVLFTPGDLGSLRDALRSVIRDAELRERLGRNAREYVARHHTWAHNAQRVMALVGHRKKGKARAT